MRRRCPAIPMAVIMRRRSAIEPVIGDLKAGHRMERNYLWFKNGDANNAVLVAVGYNFRWLRRSSRRILSVLFGRPPLNPA
jgi:transposase, IS5 family